MITPDGGEAGAAGSPPGRVLATRGRTESDLDECVNLMAEVHRRDGYPLRWPADPRRFLGTSKIFAAWVATVDGQVAGHVALSVVSPDDAAPQLLGVTCSAPASGEGARDGEMTGTGGTPGRGGAAAGGGSGTAGGRTSGGSGAAGAAGGTAGGGVAAGGSGMAGAAGGTAGGGTSGGSGVAGAAGGVAGGGVAAGGNGAAGDAGTVSSGGVAMVSRLFVGTAARGYGAGRALMHQATEAAHERGLHLLLDVHSANTSAIALYERLGWNFIGTSRAQWGPDQVTLLSYTAPSRLHA